MEHLMAVILAAGEGKRMKSAKSKVVHEICGKALIEWVARSVLKAGIEDRVFVVGHKAEQVKECLGENIQYALQEVQLGTGHAVMQAERFLRGKEGQVVILCGDMPLIRPETIMKAVRLHRQSGNSATVITADLDNPAGYGRIVRDERGNVLKIVEHKDTNEEERNIREVNSGIYCFNIMDLLHSLKELGNSNSQGEYYLTDIMEIFVKKGLKVDAFKVEDSSEILGINDRVQLAEAAQVLRKRILEEHMRSGVTLVDPGSTYIDGDVEIGMDTVIYPGTILEGKTKIGENCILGPNSRLVDCVIGNDTEVANSVVIQSSVGSGTHIGPFAYIRPESSIGNKVKIGDFVEIKKSRIGDKTKISHLTYVGDAEVGKNVNLGCGVVVVNYDGRNKYKTVVEDNAFVGCNVNLISPVTVRSNAYIAAGSTIVGEVPENSLAIARSKQEIKEGWVIKKGLRRKE
ncbi:MAG: bifunctional UDP-N-acetylglucosamine diphosphorylase/glucosamine-1-phosphate N-acetyltransferase GlmU [Clostridiales bacterium]|jgi:bifunctional UDP-N-acetylglucosamine pyrophosphorylase/glucosamine-1-phosphate N-acetyltransferase|nr:bifunctional UDP-N-acetylglucosamine diphosphorylase/glucosamine-1-phosphate N-acetyltransferase GlmU [Eubacteriales bacterium]MDH7567032.1 bifunctional UDP-N-acetylglucosamine diphosphorylase/glucosamine-1-phosphate N-acetyltransferase GlmU [Clostridiales bacterium]